MAPCVFLFISPSWLRRPDPRIPYYSPDFGQICEVDSVKIVGREFTSWDGMNVVVFPIKPVGFLYISGAGCLSSIVLRLEHNSNCMMRQNQHLSIFYTLCRPSCNSSLLQLQVVTSSYPPRVPHRQEGVWNQLRHWCGLLKQGRAHVDQDMGPVLSGQRSVGGNFRERFNYVTPQWAPGWIFSKVGIDFSAGWPKVQMSHMENTQIVPEGFFMKFQHPTNRTWNTKQPFINGYFNWMIPNLYIGNNHFTQKHPFEIGSLGVVKPSLKKTVKPPSL